MSENDNRNVINYETFKRLGHFTALSALGKNELPILILDNILEQVLYIHKKPVKINEIPTLIKNYLKLNYLLEEIRPSVARLVKTESIIQSRGMISLEVNLRNKIKSELDLNDKHDVEITKKLVDQIYEKYPNLPQELAVQIRNDFNLFLASFFLVVGAEAVQLIYGNPEEIKKILALTKRRDFLNSYTSKDEELKTIECEFFPKFVEYLSDDEKEYLQSLLDCSLQYFTLTVDKKCEALLLSDFADWYVYVDTNFIYDLMGLNDITGRGRKDAELTIELGKKAGIKFVYSYTTLEEFNMSVTSARELLLEDQSQGFYKQVCEITGNAVLCAFEQAMHSGVSPKDYLAKIENVKAILESYEINERVDFARTVKESPELRSITEAFMKTGKDAYKAEHDAFHYILILRLRDREKAGKSFSTTKSWFLSLDGILAPFDWRRRKTDIPFSIKPYQLRQILQPLFSRTDDFENVFKEFITQPVSQILNGVSSATAMDILKRIAFYEKEYKIENSTALAKTILTDQLFMGQLRKFRDDDVIYRSMVDQKITEHLDVQIQETEAPQIEPILKPSSPIEPNVDYWNWVNPFWLFWMFVKFIWKWLDKFFVLVVRHKLISIIVAVISFFGFDYSIAWSNVSYVYTKSKYLIDLFPFF